MKEMQFKTVVNARTHMVVDDNTNRSLGGVGSNYYRTWVFPLYTPGGMTVLREFPFDHPFHNGFFVGQNPVLVGERKANYWAVPPRRSAEDKVFTHVGRVEADAAPEIEPYENGVRFSLKNIWRDENEEPILDEERSLYLYAVDDATVCDMTSKKIAAYGPTSYPQTKFGSLCIRVEPRLLPPMGGIVIADDNRRGTAEVINEQDSSYVAYENELSGHGRSGVFLSILDEGISGPWFIRDYGLATYNPTMKNSISTPEGQDWTISMRVVAYDGELTEDRAKSWIEQK
jgi:hypothetical protein